MAPRTFNDILKEVNANIATAYSNTAWKEVEYKIDRIIDELNGQNGKSFKEFSVDELSRIGGTLAMLQFSLIPAKDAAYQNSKIAKASLTVQEYSNREAVKSLLKASTEKVLAKDIDLKTEASVIEHTLLLSLHEAKYERYQSLWYSINTILHRIESRIKALMLEDTHKAPSAFADGSSGFIPLASSSGKEGELPLVLSEYTDLLDSMN